MEISKGKMYVRHPDGHEELLGDATLEIGEAAHLKAEEDLKLRVGSDPFDLMECRTSPWPPMALTVSNVNSAAGKSDSARYLDIPMEGAARSFRELELKVICCVGGMLPSIQALRDALENCQESAQLAEAINRQMEAYEKGRLTLSDWAQAVVEEARISAMKRQQPFWTKDWRKGGRRGSR